MLVRAHAGVLGQSPGADDAPVGGPGEVKSAEEVADEERQRHDVEAHQGQQVDPGEGLPWGHKRGRDV